MTKMIVPCCVAAWPVSRNHKIQFTSDLSIKFTAGFDGWMMDSSMERCHALRESVQLNVTQMVEGTSLLKACFVQPVELEDHVATRKLLIRPRGFCSEAIKRVLLSVHPTEIKSLFIASVHPPTACRDKLDKRWQCSRPDKLKVPICQALSYDWGTK